MLHGQFDDRAVDIRWLFGNVAHEFRRARSIVSVRETEHQDRVAQSRLQLLARALGDDLAVVEDDQLFCQSVSFFEVLRREQYRGATLDEPFDNGPEVLATLRIKTSRWFVEEEEWWVSDEGCCQVETTSHATRIGLRRAVSGVTEAELLEEVLRARNDNGFFEVVQAPDHSKILRSGEVFVDRCVLTGKTNASSHRVGLFDHVKTIHRGSAGRGKQNRRENSHHRRLARSVGTEQPEHLSLRHVQAHVIKGANLTPVEVTFDIQRLNCEIGHSASLETPLAIRLFGVKERVPSTYGYIGQ